MTESKDPFYVGYLPLPATLRSMVQVFLAASVLGALAAAFVIAPRQQEVGPGVWNLDTIFAIEGHLSLDPYPVIYVDDPASTNGPRGVLLVSEFKFGARDRTQELAGKRVRAQGHFISREGRGLFELLSIEDAVTALDAPTNPPPVTGLGDHVLAGEIVDSKCYLGVMKPGFGKTHRACAVRCLSGGIPPGFVTRDAAGTPTFYLLRGQDGSPLGDAVLPYVAEPVELNGSLERRGDLLVYSIDPAAIRRL